MPLLGISFCELPTIRPNREFVNSLSHKQTRRSWQPTSRAPMDYFLPSADDLPSIEVELHEALTPVNVLGVKGAGENGSTGAPPAVINAIVDALGEVGVTRLDMPASPERVWRAIMDAEARTHDALGD